MENLRDPPREAKIDYSPAFLQIRPLIWICTRCENLRDLRDGIEKNGYLPTDSAENN